MENTATTSSPLSYVFIPKKISLENTNYFLLAQDPHTLDFGDIKKTGANITSFRIIDIRSPAFGDAVSDWEAKLAKLKGTSAIKFDRQRVLVRKK